MAVKKSAGDILADVQKELGNLKSIQGREPFEFESEYRAREVTTRDPVNHWDRHLPIPVRP